MEKKYWDDVGVNYHDVIFSVLANDKDGLIDGYIQESALRGGTACDFGCGAGYFVSLLAKRFKKVFAIDFSASCLEKAESLNEKLSNVSFHNIDLSGERISIPKVNFLLCVNVILSVSISVRQKLFKNISKKLLKNGKMVLVVPSMESALLSGYRLIEWNLKSGMRPCSAVRCGFENKKVSMSHVCQGIVDIDGLPTKHFLKEELCGILKDSNFEVKAVSKLKYDWKTEYVAPPRWMKEPYPWDWLVFAEKI